MRWPFGTKWLVALALVGLTGVTAAAGAPSSPGIEIRRDDVDRFFDLYDETAGRPTAERLQRDYIDRASPGLRHLTHVRNVTAANIARAVETDPEMFTAARACMASMPRARIERAFATLLRLYPEAERPPVTLLIGRGKPLAISGPGFGVQIAVEAMCSPKAARFLDAEVEDRWAHVLAHEYVHSQQAPALANTERLTVLQRSLVEGAADFVGELLSGGVASVATFASARGRELEIERRFAADMDKTDLSGWFDNTTQQDVGQLGYWAGYRIVSSFYHRAPDKRAALRAILRMTDVHYFLAKSGWRPGTVIDCPRGAEWPRGLRIWRRSAGTARPLTRNVVARPPGVAHRHLTKERLDEC